MIKFVKTIDSQIEKITSFLLVVSMGLMLSLSVFGIVLRWFNLSYPWIDPLVRHLVFLAAFLGGALATGKGRHIGIDILAKYLESKDDKSLFKIVKIIVGIVSLIGVIWLFKASIDFSIDELEYGKASFFGIHSGYLVSIIPFGFALIGLRLIALILFFMTGEKE